MTAVLEVRGLCVGYGGMAVLDGFDLTVDGGEVVALLGPNGAGKTTALAGVSGLVKPTAGTVAVGGRPVAGLAPHRVARAGLGLVPEDRSLFPSLTVAEHLKLGSGRGAVPRDEVTGWFAPLDRLWSRPVGLLSGGEQQMVAVARALVRRPKVLLVDELSLGLAPIVARSLLDTVREVARTTGCGVVVVEQHVELALTCSDRAMVLRRGEVVVAGPSAQVAADRERLASSYLG